MLVWLTLLFWFAGFGCLMTWVAIMRNFSFWYWGAYIWWIISFGFTILYLSTLFYIVIGN